MFGRRRWRMPWSSGTSGEPWSPEPVRVRWAEPSLPPAEPNVHTSDQPSSGAQMTSEAPSEAPSGAMHTSTVRVIPPGGTPSARTGTAPIPPGAIPSQPAAPPEESTGSPPGSADPTRTRVIRIPALIGIRPPGDSASVSTGAQRTRGRSRSASTAREAASVDAPPWERVGQDGPGRVAPIVIAIAVLCVLLGGLAAFAATLGGSAPASPGPAASIAPAGATASGPRAGTGAGAGAAAKHTAAKHTAAGHTAAGHASGGHASSTEHNSSRHASSTNHKSGSGHASSSAHASAVHTRSTGHGAGGRASAAPPHVPTGGAGRAVPR